VTKEAKRPTQKPIDALLLDLQGAEADLGQLGNHPIRPMLAARLRGIRARLGKLTTAQEHQPAAVIDGSAVPAPQPEPEPARKPRGKGSQKAHRQRYDGAGGAVQEGTARPKRGRTLAGRGRPHR
jgi:hypothetical protein